MKWVPALLLVAAATPAGADLTQRDLDRAGAHPAPGARLPAALAFTDQHGRMVTLGNVAGGRPLVLLFADYTCRNICGPGATLTAQALQGTGLTAGQDYSLAVIGLDPRDGVDQARSFSAKLPGLTDKAKLLIGAPATVAVAERALGYVAVYDAPTDQFAHDASAYVFDRDARLATLLPELGLTPGALKAALAGAPAPSLGERVAHLCYGLAAAGGRFAGPVVFALQALALLTLAGIAGLLWRRARA